MMTPSAAEKQALMNLPVIAAIATHLVPHLLVAVPLAVAPVVAVALPTN